MKTIRKVLLIPYISKTKMNKTRFFIVQHTESKDWTFISGTCESGEHPNKTVYRELNEETQGLIKISYLPKRTKIKKVFVIKNKIRFVINIYFIPLKRKTKLYFSFKNVATNFISNLENSENSKIAFYTYKQFQKKRIWDFIKYDIIPQIYSDIYSIL